MVLYSNQFLITLFKRNKKKEEMAITLWAWYNDLKVAHLHSGSLSIIPC